MPGPRPHRIVLTASAHTPRPMHALTFWLLALTSACALPWPAAMAQDKTHPGAAALTVSPAERCVAPAALRHGVNPQILRAILQVESAMRPHVVQRNTNGSVDVGMAQINSVHFPELAQWGITPKQLLDPCVAAHVAAWHLKRGLVRHGNTWFGVAAYHSVTPEHNARYQARVKEALMRSGTGR